LSPKTWSSPAVGSTLLGAFLPRSDARIGLDAEISGPKSHQLHDLPLRLGVRLDVALGRGEVRVTGEHLDVPQGPADRRYLSGGVGDEGPSAAVAGAAGEA
jgi:hypothetical protein